MFAVLAAALKQRNLRFMDIALAAFLASNLNLNSSSHLKCFPMHWWAILVKRVLVLLESLHIRAKRFICC